MKSVSISGSSRANVGSKDARILRVNESVPCVMYGGKEQVHFSVPTASFKPLIYTPNVHTVELNVDGKKYNAILQEVQYHRVKDHIMHVDFLEIIPGKPVVMNIPVRTTGTSPGVRAGGKLNKKLKTLKVRGLVENMPDAIEIAIDKLEIGQGISVADITVKGLTMLNASNVTVVSVQVTRASAAEPTAAATPAATPAAAKPAAPKK